jgi:hypothetical protein
VTLLDDLNTQPKTAKKLHATDMLDLLRRHYEPPPSKPMGGAFITEIQAPHSLRRADALWCPVTSGNRGQIIGHEIKVSRSDLITELHDPHKADTWLKYCHRWWLVISDEAFLEGLDIPPEWGILVPPRRANTRFMHVVQKAPSLAPAPHLMQEAWGTIFAKQTYGGADRLSALERARNDADTYRKQLDEARTEIRRLNRAIGDEAFGSGARAMKVSDILSAVDNLGSYGDGTVEAFKGLNWDVEPETVARMILAATLLHRENRPHGLAAEIAGAIKRAENATERLREAARELQATGVTDA